MQDLLSQFTGILQPIEMTIDAILPVGRNGFALDKNNKLVGFKATLLGVHQRDLDSLLKVLSTHIYLRRLVLFLDHPGLEFPSSILKLKSLRFLWIGGKCRSIPPEIARMNITLYSGTEDLQYSSLGLTRKFLSENWIEKRASTMHTPAFNNFPGTVDNLGFDPGSPEHRQEAFLRFLIDDSSEFRSTSAAVEGAYILTQSESPPVEIIEKGADALRLYYAGFGTDAGLPLNEVKVIFVGDGGAGKTSLVRRLVGDDFRVDEQQTHGINIKQWAINQESEQIRVNLWDFGGQEIMHSTHQFFLSKRSVYVVLLDGRKEEDAEYWLQHVKVFGGDSPVLVAINKIDENPSFDVNRRFLTEKYGNIVGYYRLSCKNGGGLKEFQAAIEDSVRNAPMNKTRWPRSWFDVKQKLEIFAADRPYISLNGYTELCDQEGISSSDSQDVLVDFLHDLGVVVHFKDINLLDTHVLNPRWVTEGVYRIINSKILAAKKGLLNLSDLSEILAINNSNSFSYPKDKYSYLVELMLKFELCYRIDDNKLLIPDLLDRQEPDYYFEQDANPIRFILEYDYLPKSIIARFIVRFNKDIYNNMSWRTGTILRRTSNATAIVKADDAAKRIYIEVLGTAGRDFFTCVWQVFTEIHASFEALSVRELVPLPDAPQVTVDYRELLGHERSGRAEIFVGRLQRPYDVRELLNGLLDENRRRRGSVSIFSNRRGNALFERGVGMGGDIELIARPQPWEKVVAYSASGIVLATVVFLLIRNQPISDPNLVVFTRVLLSFCTAGIGAAIPGFLHIAISTKGAVIRAAGALALFVLTYLLTPTVLPVQLRTEQSQSSTHSVSKNVGQTR